MLHTHRYIMLKILPTIFYILIYYDKDTLLCATYSYRYIMLNIFPILCYMHSQIHYVKDTPYSMLHTLTGTLC